MKKKLAVYAIACAGLTFSVGAADLTPADMADAFYWNARDGEGKIDGGDWGEAANWLKHGEAVAAPPNGVFDIVAFTTSVARAYTVRLAEDMVVSNLYVHCRPASNSVHPLVGNTVM